ncbi:hypothetical protein [Burkholderia gladioli]|uniref:hypothetical protein n=1 Tax=Burkholderia gladioli TaxID=28095 RepID=UPI0011875AC4|nr:hypothetical protein [Burkholderia gladioli]
MLSASHAPRECARELRSRLLIHVLRIAEDQEVKEDAAEDFERDPEETPSYGDSVAESSESLFRVENALQSRLQIPSKSSLHY